MAKAKRDETRGGNERGGLALKNDKGEIKTEYEELLKIMETEIKNNSIQKRELREEVITREEWDKGYQTRPQTEKRIEMEKEREEAPLTKYLNQKGQPIKQLLGKEYQKKKWRKQ